MKIYVVVMNEPSILPQNQRFLWSPANYDAGIGKKNKISILLRLFFAEKTFGRQIILQIEKWYSNSAYCIMVIYAEISGALEYLFPLQYKSPYRLVE